LLTDQRLRDTFAENAIPLLARHSYDEIVDNIEKLFVEYTDNST